MTYLLKGLLIGLIFGIPLGTVGAMTIQRTLSGGVKAGIITGLGSSVADCLYAVMGAFGMTFISDILLDNAYWINWIGGFFLLIMGVSAFFKKEASYESLPVVSITKTFLPSFFVGVTNPVVILTFIFAFTYFQIPGQLQIVEGLMLVAGIFGGTLCWWILLANVTQIIKKRHHFNHFKYMNKFFGILYLCFAAFILINNATSP